MAVEQKDSEVTEKRTAMGKKTPRGAEPRGARPKASRLACRKRRGARHVRDPRERDGRDGVRENNRSASGNEAERDERT